MNYSKNLQKHLTNQPLTPPPFFCLINYHKLLELQFELVSKIYFWDYGISVAIYKKLWVLRKKHNMQKITYDQQILSNQLPIKYGGVRYID